MAGTSDAIALALSDAIEQTILYWDFSQDEILSDSSQLGGVAELVYVSERY
jgi:hypothetical protein